MYFPIEHSTNPDYLFISVFGTTHRNPRFDKCIKIAYLNENIRPNFTSYDYSLSFDYLDDPRNLRMPYYADINFYQEEKGKSLIKPTDFDPDLILATKTKFCNFIYSNEWAKERIVFFELLSKYKKVDSGGRVKNNLGFQVDDKLSFILPYKFTLAFENSSYPGYVTEKLIEPMFSNSIPIYLGNPRVSEEFNPRSFINCHEHDDWQSMIERIIEIDQDDSLYRKCLKAPWLYGNKPNIYCQPDYMVPFFQMVFADKRPRTSRPAVEITCPGCNPRWKIIL
jgi:hypothetical protein